MRWRRHEVFRIMNQERCTEPGCTGSDAYRLYDGKPLCAIHYWEVLSGALMSAFETREAGDEVPRRFKYLLGRVHEEMDWTTEGGSYLSAARISGVQPL